VKPIDPDGFERKFRENIDPWNYRASPFEAFKRRVLLRACGPGIRGRGLELACAIGETSRALAPLCLRLLAVDSSPTALAHALERHGGAPRLRFGLAELPAAMPRGPFDLIVASEIAYYLAPRALQRLADAVSRSLAPGGRVVVLHHLRPFEDAAQLPALAQRRMTRFFERTMRKTFDERHARFAAAAFRKPLM
jgi:SAM-dependent methyltransferase